MSLTTIMCDASFCPETGAGGYGFYIASNHGKVGGGGPFKAVMKDSLLAEMAAVVNSLVEAHNRGLFEAGDHCLFQIDCVAAIDRLLNRHYCKSATEISLFDIFHANIQKYNVTFSFRHVKGHSRKRDARNLANNHCDKRAKDAMRLFRQQLRSKNETG